MHKVVVTGIGLATAAGLQVKPFWERIVAGQSAVASIRTMDVTDFPTQIGAEIDLATIETVLTPKTSSRLSRISKFACYAARQAIADAVGPGAGLQQNTGVFIGCSQGGYVESEPFFNKHFEKKAVSPYAILKPMNSAPATNVSIQCNLHGPVITIDTACSSANHAIGLASMMIASGNLGQAVVGGVDTVFSPAIFHNWCALYAMTRRNDHPHKACKPFSKNRDGTVLGEGAGMVVLESEESALARGAHIYGEIAGYGQSGDAFHLTQSTADGLSAAISHALQQAKVCPEKVDYISAHATGTLLNDATETLAIKQVFGEHAYQIPISGVKPVLGHTLAASAALELIVCLLALRDGVVPPTINYEEADPACDLDYVTEGARHHQPKVCLSNSFGFGGSNAVLVIKKYEQ